MSTENLIEDRTSQQALLSIYETAMRIRAFDDLAQKLIGSGQEGFVHYPVRGHEIIAAAVAASIDPSDYMTATYRGLADEVAKGVPLKELWAERLGKVTGTSKGRGGPMHISDPAHGLMVMSGIVGGGIPIAAGLALSSDLRGDGRVTICNFGDGATNIGAFHEALNLAAVWNLPVVFVCQNNQYGEHTPFAETQRIERVADRAAAYGMRGMTIDGTDPVETAAAARQAVAHARSGAGPVLLECVTFRTLGHVLSDKNEYMDQDVLSHHRQNDLLTRFRHRLLSLEYADAGSLDALESRVRSEVEEAYTAAASDEPADPAKVLEDIVAAPKPATAGDVTSADPPTTMREAIKGALDLALTRDPEVFLLGEDIADTAGGGVFNMTSGLSTRHGLRRVRNTPIAEEAIVGAAIGAALAGMKPIAEVMFMDFLGVCFDQLANHAAKLRYMSGGRTTVPMVLRVNMVGGTPLGAQHSQSLEALLMHTPGLKVVYPSTAYDAKGLLLACIEDEDPCVFIEANSLMMKKTPVPEGHYTVPLGEAVTRRVGSDVTILSWGRMMGDALKAAEVLQESDGISAEVLDLRSLVPLDEDAILSSVAKTRRAVVVHEAVRTGGPGAEISSRIHEHLHGELLAPVRRVTAPDSPVPASRGLVSAFYPNADTVADTVHSMLA
jgi:pyruvate/2-oxoglutarate/acetoin dehydrogenase E1 component/TPP-dependent pyruvate/acetoin dehydrogenase alpha subunit